MNKVATKKVNSMINLFTYFMVFCYACMHAYARWIKMNDAWKIINSDRIDRPPQNIIFIVCLLFSYPVISAASVFQ